jgi:hypothetical protein
LARQWKEVKTLRETNEIPKKGTVIFAQERPGKGTRPEFPASQAFRIHRWSMFSLILKSAATWRTGFSCFPANATASALNSYSSRFFESPVEKEFRSLMNIPFVPREPDPEKRKDMEYTRRSLSFVPIFSSSVVIFPAYLCVYRMG